MKPEEPQSGALPNDQSSDATRATAPPPVDIQPTESLGATPTHSNAVIGPYKLMRLLGKGGMGEVWMAEQEKPVRRRVALKVIKSGGSSKEILARFEAERQALALMDHPNIARIVDAGTTNDGQPFFAMELVQGPPITDYCTSNKLGIKERLHLFTEVCRGVQHAHQKGIIHRDLKPSNILVGMVEGKPVPKIIDFGLAKALENVYRLTDKSLYTGIGQILGTLRYMSPEQASLNPLDVDTRSDVYSLGIVLYELLTGGTPLDDESLRDQAILSVLEQIRNKEPIKPSSRLSNSGHKLASITDERRTDSHSLSKILVGDLDWIVMKALEKDRTRRYESASHFAMDIERFLDSEPILARPPSVSYRVSKFIKRNRLLVVGASTLLLALLLGMAGTSFGLLRAWQAEGVAEKRLEESLAAQKQLARSIDILTGVFDDFDISGIREGTDPLEQVLANRLVASAQLLDEEAVGDTLVVARLQTKLSMALLSLGFPKPAVDLLNQVLEAERQLEGNDSDAVLATYLNLATAYEKAGEPESALPLIEKALEGNRKQHGPHHEATLTSLNRYANAIMELGDFQKAIPILEEVFQIQESAPNQDIEEKIVTMTLLAQAHSAAGDVLQAIPLFEKVLSIARSNYVDGHLTTLTAMNNLAAAYLENNELEKASELFERTLGLSKTHLGESHPDTISSMNSLAMSYQFLGRLDEAVTLFEDAVSRQKIKLGPDHPETLINQNNLAIAYQSAGKPDKALPLAEETLKLTEAKLGADHPDTLGCMNTLASLLVKTGKPELAKPIRIRVIEGMKANYGAKHPLTLRSIANLAAVHSALGQHQESNQLLQETLALRESELGDQHPDTLGNRRSLGVSFAYLGDFDQAIPLVESALEGQRKLFGDEHPETLATTGTLATMYSSSNKTDKAIALLEQTLKAQRVVLGTNHPEVLARNNDLVLAYIDKQLWDKATPLANENLSLARKNLGESHQVTLEAKNAYARIIQSNGSIEEAIPLFEEVLALQRANTGNDHPDAWDSMAALASALLQANQEEAAILLLEEASAGMEKLNFGYRSARDILGQLTDTYDRLGRLEKSEAWHRKYCDVLRRAGSQRQAELMVELGRLSKNLLKQEKWNEAQIAAGELLELQREISPDGEALCRTLNQYGLASLGLKRYAEAEKHLVDSYRTIESKKGNPSASERTTALETLEALVKLFLAMDRTEEMERWIREKDAWLIQANGDR